MKKLFFLYLFFSICIFGKTQEKIYSGVGFSVQYSDMAEHIIIVNRTNKVEYSTGPLETAAIKVGMYYKGLGIEYTPGFAGKTKDEYSDNYSTYSGFQIFYYHKILGVDFYRSKFEGFWVGHDALLQYRPEWVMNNDGFHWTPEMNSRNQTLNIYCRLFGKKKLT